MNAHEIFNTADLAKIDKIASISGSLKKMREDNLVSMFSSSVTRHFRFFCHGRILVYYEEDPNYTDTPKNVVVLDEIVDIKNDNGGKRGQFLLAMKNGHNMVLKHDDPTVADTWVKVITDLKAFYKDKPLGLIDINRKWKEKPDIRVRMMVVEELESKGRIN